MYYKFEEIKKIEDENKVVHLDIEDGYFLNEEKGYEYRLPEDFTYYSKVLNKNRKAKVLLPPNYTDKQEYNLLVVLHGYKGRIDTWIKMGAHKIIQNLMYFENLPKTITVFVDSNLNDEENLYNYELHDSIEYFNKTKDELMESLLSSLESEFSIKRDRNSRAIVGQSLGGRNAIYTAFSNPGQFAYVGGLAPSKLIKDGHPKFNGFFEDFSSIKNIDFNEVFICLGKEDDVVAYEVGRLKNRLDMDNIKYTFSYIYGGHDQRAWKLGLYNFARRIFK